MNSLVQTGNNPWNFVEPLTPYSGYVNSIEGAEELINNFEVITSSRFSIEGTQRDFGKFKDDNGVLLKHAVRFEGRTANGKKESPIPLKGIPFIQHGNQRRQCQHGKVRSKWVPKKVKDDGGPVEKKRFRIKPSKKCGCKASIVMREVTVFPQFRLTVDTKHKRTIMSLKIRDLLQKNEIKGEHRIYIDLPKPEDHSNHVIEKKVDPSVSTKIEELAKSGISDVNEMSVLIEEYVKQDILGNAPLTERKRRRLIPSKRDVQMHINAANCNSRYSRIEQEKLQTLIEKWKMDPNRADDLFHFKRHQDNESEAQKDTEGSSNTNNALFVHQTSQQRRLLKRYGNDICFLDATCKTIKPDCPLFFLVVKTNVDFQVVAEFIAMDITCEAIAAALEVIKEHNPDWNPKNFMVGCTDEEVSALSDLFAYTTIHVCEYQRDYAWEDWLSRNVSEPVKVMLLKHLKKIAKSSEESEFEATWNELQMSDVWQHPDSEELREWFINTWLKNAEKWVWALRKARLQPFLKLSTGVDNQSRLFKEKYLQNLVEINLSEILRMVVEDFVPDNCKSYVDTNLTSSSLHFKYNPLLPSYLVDRPKPLINHCLSQIKASDNIPDESIVKVSQGVYTLQDAKQTYITDFNLPGCNCREFSFHGLPCKHMFAIMRSQETWQSLPESYRDSSFLILDTDITLMEQHMLGIGIRQVEGEAVETPKEQSEEVKAVKYKRNAAAKCRAVGRTLIALTYTARDEDLLRKAEKKAVEAVRILKMEKQQNYDTSVKKAKPSPEGKKVLKIPQKRRKRNALTKQQIEKDLQTIQKGGKRPSSEDDASSKKEENQKKDDASDLQKVDGTENEITNASNVKKRKKEPKDSQELETSILTLRKREVQKKLPKIPERAKRQASGNDGSRKKSGDAKKSKVNDLQNLNGCDQGDADIEQKSQNAQSATITDVEVDKEFTQSPIVNVLEVTQQLAENTIVTNVEVNGDLMQITVETDLGSNEELVET